MMPDSAKTAACLEFFWVGFMMRGLDGGVRLLATDLICSNLFEKSVLQVVLLSLLYSCEVFMGRLVFIGGMFFRLPFCAFFLFFDVGVLGRAGGVDTSYRIRPSSLGMMIDS